MLRKLSSVVLLLFGFLLGDLPAPADVSGAGDDAVVERVLLEGIEANFAGEYARASSIFDRLGTIHPDHPAPDFYLATVLFWRNSVDPADPRDDDEIKRRLNRCIRKAEAWLERDGDRRLEALHYLGLAYTYLGRLEAQRGDVYAGGTHGEKGRDYLEQVIQACADRPVEAREAACEDVYFPFGAYAYFAGRLPGFLRMVSFLWFVPRGTTEEGLEALERARANSRLHHLGATSLLAQIYSIFEEDRRDRARVLSTELVTRFPDNPSLNLQHASLLLRLGRPRDAEAVAQRLLDRLGKGVSGHDDRVALAARLIQAEAALGRADLERAGAILAAAAEVPAARDTSLTPRVALLQGMLLDARGKREEAVALYERAADNGGRTLNRQAGRIARRYLETPYVPPATLSPAERVL